MVKPMSFEDVWLMYITYCCSSWKCLTDSRDVKVHDYDSHRSSAMTTTHALGLMVIMERVNSREKSWNAILSDPWVGFLFLVWVSRVTRRCDDWGGSVSIFHISCCNGLFLCMGRVFSILNRLLTNVLRVGPFELFSIMSIFFGFFWGGGQIPKMSCIFSFRCYYLVYSK